MARRSVSRTPAFGEDVFYRFMVVDPFDVLLDTTGTSPASERLWPNSNTRRPPLWGRRFFFIGDRWPTGRTSQTSYRLFWRYR